MINKTSRVLSTLLAIVFIALTANSTTTLAHHNPDGGDWKRSDKQPVVFLHADGRVVELTNRETGGNLVQGYNSVRDDKRNVEIGHFTGNGRNSRTELVFRPASRGYWFIISLKTGLYLTKDGNDDNVSNWGRQQGWDNQEWAITMSEPDFQKNKHNRYVYISNKATGKYLAHSQGNIGIWGSLSDGKVARQWLVSHSIRLNETMPFNFVERSADKNYSTNLTDLFKLTITSVKAIKTSTGQDGATKVLFSGIDLALEMGMAAATGGGSAGASAGAKVAKAGRAVTRSAVMASARAASIKAAKENAKAVLKEKAKEYAKQQALRQAKGLIGDKIILPNPEQMAAEAFADTEVYQMSQSSQAVMASLDVLDALSSEAIFNKIYPSSPDDLEIAVNGSRIWPNGGQSDGRKISSQQTLPVNKTFIFPAGRGITIELAEYDYGSDDDDMGSTSWSLPKEDGWFERFVESQSTLWYRNVLISKNSEGSLYEITYKIEPLNSLKMTQGILDKKTMDKRITQAKKRALWVRCTKNQPGKMRGDDHACYQYAKRYQNDNMWMLETHKDEAKFRHQNYVKGCNLGIGGACEGLLTMKEKGCKAGKKYFCDAIKEDERVAKYRSNYKNELEKLEKVYAAFDARRDQRKQARAGCDQDKIKDCYRYANYMYSHAKILKSPQPGSFVVDVKTQKNDMWPMSAKLFIGLCELGKWDSCEMRDKVLAELCKHGGQQEYCEVIQTFKNEKLVVQCVAGEPEACQDLGNQLFAHTDKTSTHWDAAEVYFKQACDAGLNEGCKKFKSITSRSCTQGKANSCLKLGRLYRNDAIDASSSSLKGARLFFKKGCELNSSDSCLEIATMELLGVGSAVNRDAALRWYSRACELGEQSACDANTRL